MQKPMANVVAKSSRIKLDIKVNYYKHMEEVKDKSLPTLIIGLQEAKKSISDFDILIKEYQSQNLWWTFSKTERGVDYQDDIIDFCNKVINNIVNEVTYEYVNLYECTYYKIKNILRYLLSNDNKVCYNDNNSFLFIYSKKYKKIWGFSLSTLRFYGIKEKNIDKIINNIKNAEFINNFSRIPSKIKKTVGDKLHYNIVLYDYFG